MRYETDETALRRFENRDKPRLFPGVDDDDDYDALGGPRSPSESLFTAGKGGKGSSTPSSSCSFSSRSIFFFDLSSPSSSSISLVPYAAPDDGSVVLASFKNRKKTPSDAFLSNSTKTNV